MIRHLVIDERAAGERLDVVLAARLDTSRSRVQDWLRQGLITVDGVVRRASYLVSAGERCEVADEPAPEQPAAPPQLPIVYEDDDMVVVNKPAGLSVHGGNGRSHEATVADFARTISSDPDPERPGIVHRLDRDTSGLLVIAKSAEAKAKLQQQWQNRGVKKTYVALVVGRLEPPAAVIDLPLDRDPAHPTRRRAMTTGRPAVTRYETIASYPGYTYLRAFPETGRTHQLRVHLATLGHPIAGDIIYGPKVRPLGLMRQFLHASALELTTPSGQPLKLTCELPADLLAVRTAVARRL